MKLTFEPNAAGLATVLRSAPRLAGRYETGDVASGERADVLVVPFHGVGPADYPTAIAATVDRHAAVLDRSVVVLDASYEGRVLSPAETEAVDAVLEARRAQVRRAVQLQQCRGATGAEGHRAASERLHLVHFHSIEALVAAQAERHYRGPRGAAFVAGRRRAYAEPTRLFSALMHRPSPHRLVLFGWLVANGALSRGHVSFYGDAAAGDRPLARSAELAVARFPGHERYVRAALDSPLSRRPFKNFEEPTPNLVAALDLPVNRGVPMALVTETDMSGCLRYTEKSLKPPLHLQSFLVAGIAGTLGLLAETGLAETGFDPSYDGIASAEARLAAVLDAFDDYLRKPDLAARCERAIEAMVDGAARFVAEREDRLAASLARLEEACAA